MQLPVTYTEITLLKYCKNLLPEKSYLIINFNPALSSFYLGKEQKILPFSRELEYAGKVIALEKISSAASFRKKMPESAVDHSTALRALPEKKVFLPFPSVVADSFPEKYNTTKNTWLLTEKFLSGNKVFITNLALYQIPEKYKERFMRETRLHTVASEGPVKLYRVYPASLTGFF